MDSSLCKNNNFACKDNRIAELDIIKAIAIIGVMYVHFDKSYVLNVPGVAFHVVAFFAVTGILLYKKKNDDLKSQVIKSIKTILVPYWLLSVIYTVLHLMLGLIKKNDAWHENLVYDVYRTLSGLGIGTLWFLPTLFGAELIFLFMKKYIPYYRCILSFCVVPAVLVSEVIFRNYLSVNGDTIVTDLVRIILQIIIAVCSMALGTYMWEFISFIQNKKYATVCFAVMAIIFIAIDVSLWNMYRGNDLHLAKITNGISYIICTYVSIMAVFCISKIVVQFNWLCNAMGYLGKNSIIIMTTHFEYKMVVLSQFISVSLFGPGILCKLVSLPILCLIEVVICFVVNKTFVRKIYGRK